MVRAYRTDEPVPGAVIDEMLAHAIRAPSAGFSQGWDFLVLRDRSDVDRFWDSTTDRSDEADSWLQGLMTAPVLIVCLSDKDRYRDRYAEPDKGWSDRSEAHWPVPYWDVDTGMAAMLMLLTAVDHGLGACFFGVPPEHHDRFRADFDIPSNRTPVGVISLGHPAPDRRSPSLKRGRRPIPEVAHLGRFGTPYPTD